MLSFKLKLMKTIELKIPSFKREECKIGIVHLGVGNFHRAHQALYINNYIEENDDKNWGICGINLRKEERENFSFLKERDGKYVLKTASSDGEIEFSEIHSIQKLIDWSKEKEEAEKILCDKDIEILTKVEYSQSDSPGSDISHYQIRADTKLFNFINESTISTQSIFHEYTKGYLAESLLIDYGGINSCLSNYFKGYVDLSENSDPKEALYNLYNVLHQINDIREIRNVLVFDFYSNKAGYYQVLYDRLYRCCSGKKILIPLPDVESIGSFE